LGINEKEDEGGDRKEATERNWVEWNKKEAIMELFMQVMRFTSGGEARIIIAELIRGCERAMQLLVIKRRIWVSWKNIGDRKRL
jgi:hypothetical protein